MNRREHVHFRYQAFKRTPSANVTVSRNVIRQSLCVEPIQIRRSFPSSASLCRPRFSFFFIQLSKNRRIFASRAASLSASALRGKPKLARLNSSNQSSIRRTKTASEANPVGVSSVAAVVGERYIGRHRVGCQRGISNFLRALCESFRCKIKAQFWRAPADWTNEALNCPHFRPDSRHKQKGSSTGLRTGLCLTSIDTLNF